MKSKFSPMHVLNTKPVTRKYIVQGHINFNMYKQMLKVSLSTEGTIKPCLSFTNVSSTPSNS